MAAVVLLALWALWPPAEEAETAPPGGALPGGGAAPPGVKHTIKFSPGMSYMPGSVPYGIGKPLRGLETVLREFEARFPDTRVQVINVPINREYLVTQLSSGMAPDILNVNVEDVWVDVQKNWYVPLDKFLESPNEFVREKGDPAAPGFNQWWDMFKYQAISRGKAAPDGLMYCVSYDMVETAIFYNKDIFRKAGVGVPQTWEEFMALCEKLEATPVPFDGEAEPRAVTPVILTVEIMADWCNDLFFDQLYGPLLPGIDLLKDPLREPYLQGYLDDVELCFLHRKGFFTERDPRYREGWRIMREFRRHCNKSIGSTIDFLREFATQRGAMIWLPCTLAHRLKNDHRLGFEWGQFYPPPFTKKTSKYASGAPMCVIGGSSVQLEVTNSALGDTPAGLPFAERIEKSERLGRVMQFLQFLCLPENHERIVNEYEGFLPNIKGVETLPVLKPFEEILARPYTTTKWVFSFDLRFYETLRRLLELYLNDGTDLDGFMEWQQANLRAAMDNLERRKPVPMEEMERAWRELAPVRAQMEDLPGGL